MQNVRLNETQAGIRVVRRKLNNFRYEDDTTLMAGNEEERKNLLVKMKEKSEKTFLKLNIKESKILTSCPITWWKIEWERMETVTDFIFFGDFHLQKHCRWRLQS